MVDSDATSKLLLQRGRLQTRTTIIPLNKIAPHVLPRDTVRLAQDVGGGPGQVQLALELVAFPAEARPALAWVFGSTLVCSSLEAAKRVTFHPRVRARTVTLDGDVFDPSGTLSGGARQKVRARVCVCVRVRTLCVRVCVCNYGFVCVQGGSVLLQLAELKQLEASLRDGEAELAQCNAELSAMKQAADTHAALTQK